MCAQPHAVDIQVHDLGKRIFWVLIEWCAPGCACIGEQDVHMIGVFRDFRYQTLYLALLGQICWNRDCLAVARESVQCRDSLLTGLGLARCDEDLGAASLDEAERWINIVFRLHNGLWR